MPQAILDHAIAQPGGRLELRHPELPVGARVEITLRVANPGIPVTPGLQPSLLSLLEAIHRIPFAATSRRAPEAQEAYIQDQRNQWD